MFQPSYIETYKKGILEKRIEAAYKIIENCHLCPRNCRVNRLAEERGTCKTGKHAIVSSYNPHFGEEDPLVGTHGSGTIFMAWCNLLCIFCQNYEISHMGEGREVTSEEFANMMLSLQKIGCHNINFVTPTHVIPQILSALTIAIEGGLHIPLVYNTGCYDVIKSLKLLDGIFDIYMPDFKYWEGEVAEKYSHAKNYPIAARAALKEMYRQVGDLKMDERGIAYRGLLVRHLVMPHNLAGTRNIMRFLAKEISPNTYVNVMPQYRPCGLAYKYPEINRSITTDEYNEAIQMAIEEGITRLDERKGIRIIRWL
ncbi:MAG TPA: radical SAM protein [Syntrophaceae bacterium]|nr:radical SAM protein [Syntrophaceae bacterium]